MSKGGGGGGTQTTVSKTEVDPDIKAAYLGNVDYARDVANAMGQRQYAGFNPQYQAGEQVATAAALGGPGMQNLDTAAQMTQMAGGYAPLAVGPNQALTQAYYNPYQQDVINTGLADLERARMTAVGQTGQQAMAAKAFGGSRHGVAEALTNQQYGTQAGNMIANLRAQGFQNAQQMAQQAQQLNQAADLSGAQFRLGAAGQLGQMGQQQQAGQYNAANVLMGLGGARQQLAQQQLDAQRGLGLERLGIMSGALGLQMPGMGGTVTSTGPQQYTNPAMGALGGAAIGSQIAGLGPYGWAIGGGLGLLGSM